ncbi:hypothetical protein AB0D09_04440 [Streptomyces sp. NPDC049097]|uniref:hypothetical protein n=1 Tax=Streptomyces sp. NPDC049097 TaxID=3155497 RepID=UPI003447EC70
MPGQQEQSSLGIEYAGEGVAAAAWWARTVPMLTMSPFAPPAIMLPTTVCGRRNNAG